MASAGVLYLVLAPRVQKSPKSQMWSVNCKVQQRAGRKRTMKPKPQGKDCCI